MGDRKRLLAVSVVLLSFVACGGSESSDSAAPSDEETTLAPIDYGPDVGTECLETKKGRVIEVMAGKPTDEQFAEVTWYPNDIKVPAGEFVTLEITNPTVRQHDFTSEDLDCGTDSFGKGETVTVSFEVPAGKSDFVCNIHDAFMTGDIIGTK